MLLPKLLLLYSMLSLSRLLLLLLCCRSILLLLFLFPCVISFRDGRLLSYDFDHATWVVCLPSDLYAYFKLMKLFQQRPFPNR